MVIIWNDLSDTTKVRITGKLLGDGGITKQNGRQPRFTFMHRLLDKDWANYCYEVLRETLLLSKPRYKKVLDERVKAGFTEAVQCQSRTSTLITYLEEQWYNTRRKKIPFALLEECMNAECLAWWYQDDGHLKLQNNQPTKIILSTESFTREENLSLIIILKEKFQLCFSIDKKNRLALYDRSSVLYFLYLVNPYIQPCMTRKKSINNTKYFVLPSKRTTLYLPSTYQLQKPTQEINRLLNNLENVWNSCITKQFYKDIYEPFHAQLNTNRSYQVSYQIVITAPNTSYLYSLKQYTGLTYCQLAHLCLLQEKGPQ